LRRRSAEQGLCAKQIDPTLGWESGSWLWQIAPAMTTPSAPGGIEITNTRIFPVPRERLFAAFADPEQLPIWWGPEGFTNTLHKFDLRPGGEWKITLHGPNGADYDNEKVFAEVDPPRRVSFRHLGPMHAFLMTMTYDEVEGGTRLTWLMQFEPDVQTEKLKDFIQNANEQNFDRLQAFLLK
jgi:uncharacterized protein YndB with AHSA1/START domain